MAIPLFFLRGIGVFDDSLFLRFGELVWDGLLPYQDLFDNKPPGIYYLSAAIASVSGGHWILPRIFLFTWGILFGLGVVRYVQVLWGSVAALIAALVFGLSYPLAQGYSLHTEQFSATFAFIALVVVSCKDRHGLTAWAFAGILLGVAFQFKQPALLFVIAFTAGIFLEARHNRNPLKEFVQKTSVLLAGFLLFQCVIVFGVFYLGIAESYFDAVVTNAIYMADQPLNIVAAIKLWCRIPAVSFSVISISLVALNDNLRRSVFLGVKKGPLAISFMAGLITLVPTLKIGFEHGHYAGMSIPFLTILVSVVLTKVYGLSRSGKATGLMPLKVSSLVFALVVATYVLAVAWGSAVMIHQKRLEVDLSEWAEVNSTLEVMPDVREKILCLSRSRAPQCYYMVKRRPATRYIFFWENTDQYFSFSDAVGLLLGEGVSAAVVELVQNGDTCTSLVLSQQDCAKLFEKYTVEIPSATEHPRYGTRLAVLIKN